MGDNASQPGNLWIVFALLTVVNWGLYGVLLHSGQIAMRDPDNGRYKAFLWVGIAYVLIAVLAPAAMLLVNQASWAMPMKGVVLSTIAGAVGAIGAFCVLLAFGARGHPAVVMSIIFAGAPIVNAVVVITKAGHWGHVSWKFMLGIVLAAAGGMMVTLFRPAPGPAKPPPPTAASVEGAPR